MKLVFHTMAARMRKEKKLIGRMDSERCFVFLNMAYLKCDLAVQRDVKRDGLFIWRRANLALNEVSGMLSKKFDT